MNVIAAVRRILRIGGSIVFSLFMYLLAVLLNVFSIGQPKLNFRIKCLGARIWGYGLAWIWGMRIRVSGPRPKPPFFLVSNHLSYTDIILVCAVCPAWFISKSEVAGWPGIGALTRVGPTIYINRELRRDVTRMNQLIADLVLDGGAVGFFPEGTTTNGEEVLPFKPSLFQPAVEMELPVTTASIHYETRPGMKPARDVVAWYGDQEFAPHASTLFAQPGFTAYIRFGEKTLTGSDRKQLALSAHNQVLKNLETLRAEIRR